MSSTYSLEKYRAAKQALLDSKIAYEKQKEAFAKMEDGILQEYYRKYPENMALKESCVDDYELDTYDWTDHRVQWPESIISNKLIVEEDIDIHEKYMKDIDRWDTMYFEAKIKAILDKKD